MIVEENDIDIEILRNNCWKENDNSFRFPDREEKSAFSIKIWKNENKIIVRKFTATAEGAEIAPSYFM